MWLATATAPGGILQPPPQAGHSSKLRRHRVRQQGL